MKWKWNANDSKKSLDTFFVAAASIAFFYLLKNLSAIFSLLGALLSILTPFLWGFALAYLLHRPVAFFEKKVFCFLQKKKPRPKLTRLFSIFIVLLLFLSFLTGLILIIIPPLFDNILHLLSQAPAYLSSLQQNALQFLQTLKLNLPLENLDWNGLIQKIIDLLPSSIPHGINAIASFGSGIANFFLGLISCIYFLVSKEMFIAQFKKMLFALFPEDFTRRMIQLSRESNQIFSNFFTGKLLESLIVALLNLLVLSVAGIPYSLLISVLMGIFNIIPFFGPFIGAIPCGLLLLVIQPRYALWFLLLTILLQQIDGQFLGPKILGNSTRLTAFWVIFSIIVGGGLFGLLGMILGIPVFAVLYSLLTDFINSRLEKKGLSTQSEQYHSQKTKSSLSK